MARRLRFAGLAIMAVTAWLVLADTLGWTPSGVADPWVRISAGAGIVCLGGGILLGLLSPVGRHMRRGRCARCGAPVEPRQTYCLDHLRETVDQYRDRTRKQLL